MCEHFPYTRQQLFHLVRVGELKQLLEAEGVEQSKALCEHFSQSRAELYEIITATSIRTFSGLIDRFGSGRGSDICKPAVA
jgi:nitrite reductase (NADH) large subunit